MSVQFNPVHVFDLDGVITDPANSQVDNKVVDAMDQLLAAGTYLAINTGRSFEWVEQHLIGRLKADKDEISSRFIVVCEKGGEMATWWDGRWSVAPSEFALPHALYEITKTTFDRNKEQLKSMFWDSTKRTMATIEKLPSADLTDFHAEQKLLVEKLSGSLADQEVRIDPTTIATDIESPSAGKHAGAQLIYQWIRSFANVDDYSFISIGDSVSDYEMARYFAEKGTHSTFVYVGKPTDMIRHDDSVVFVPTEAHYASGTLEFLSRHPGGAMATR
jgi:hydroxymethylpyrimidine pyrophosphatase-like HAD family hydrolase